MKIGILTQPLFSNYGGVLQAYALQAYLQKQGCEVWIIDRKNNKVPYWRVPLGVCKRILLKYVLRKQVFVFGRNKKKQLNCKFRNIVNFIEENIRKTEIVTSDKDLKKIVNAYGFDTIVVGSDQVWRPCYTNCLKNYFLDFLPEESKVKKIAYAASFGVDDWEFSVKQTKECSKLLRYFDFVSVREDSGIEFCKKKFGVTAIQLLDPTMLLTPKDYLQLVKLPDKCKKSANLWTYVLDLIPDKQAVIQNISAYFGLQVSGIDENIEIALPVTSWIQGIYEADFVVTDSFHGCVFSILFNKPFIVYGNSGRGMTRFHSLLKMFNLEERLIYKACDLDENVLQTKIDWLAVNRKLDTLRERADCFWNEILKIDK